MKALSILSILSLLSGLFVFADHHESKTAAASPSKSAGNRVFEMRTYYTNPGKLEALHTRFRDHTNGLFVKHGMSLVGYWVPNDQEDVLVYILAYPSMEAREISWQAFMADPVWKKAWADSKVDGPLVKKVESQYLSATNYSPIQ